MKKLIAILGSTFILVIFTSLPCWADPCFGDFDCDGNVTGSDLALFAADFGRTDCGSNISKVIGWVSFEELGEVDLRSLQLTLHHEVITGGGGTARTEFDDIKILIAADYKLTPDLNLMAANGEVLPEVTIFFGDRSLMDPELLELLKLQSVLITNIKYLPPVTSGAPFLLDISLNFRKIFFSWAGQKVDWDLVLNQGDYCNQDNFHFVNLIDYAGPNIFPDYTHISAFSFAMAKIYPLGGAGRPEFEAVEIKSAVSDVSPCLFSKIASQDNINEVTIEKWGASFDKFPEARIKLEGALSATFSIYSTSAGDLAQKAAFNYNKIWWTYWGESDPDQIMEWKTGWDVEANMPL